MRFSVANYNNRSAIPSSREANAVVQHAWAKCISMQTEKKNKKEEKHITTERVDKDWRWCQWAKINRPFISGEYLLSMISTTMYAKSVLNMRFNDNLDILIILWKVFWLMQNITLINVGHFNYCQTPLFDGASVSSWARKKCSVFKVVCCGRSREQTMKIETFAAHFPCDSSGLSFRWMKHIKYGLPHSQENDVY